MVYHSKLNDVAAETVCGCALLPLKTSTRGPAPPWDKTTDDSTPQPNDILDETLAYFKANVLFKHFEVKGAADRVLVYMTLYTTQCLRKLEPCATAIDGLKALTQLAHDDFSLPGQSNFPLGTFFPAPQSQNEAGASATIGQRARTHLHARARTHTRAHSTHHARAHTRRARAQTHADLFL